MPRFVAYLSDFTQLYRQVAYSYVYVTVKLSTRTIKLVKFNISTLEFRVASFSPFLNPTFTQLHFGSNLLAVFMVIACLMYLRQAWCDSKIHPPIE